MKEIPLDRRLSDFVVGIIRTALAKDKQLRPLLKAFDVPFTSDLRIRRGATGVGSPFLDPDLKAIGCDKVVLNGGNAKYAQSLANTESILLDDRFKSWWNDRGFSMIRLNPSPDLLHTRNKYKPATTNKLTQDHDNTPITPLKTESSAVKSEDISPFTSPRLGSKLAYNIII